MGHIIACADVTEPGILFGDTVSKTLWQNVKLTERQQLEGWLVETPEVLAWF